jgi:hypothetical protein
MIAPARRALAAEIARALRAPLALLVVYLLLRALLAATTGHSGVFTPDGHVNPALIVLTLSVIVLRLLVLFALPALVLYRVATRLLAERPR